MPRLRRVESANVSFECPPVEQYSRSRLYESINAWDALDASRYSASSPTCSVARERDSSLAARQVVDETGQKPPIADVEAALAFRVGPSEILGGEKTRHRPRTRSTSRRLCQAPTSPCAG